MTWARAGEASREKDSPLKGMAPGGSASAALP